MPAAPEVPGKSRPFTNAEVDQAIDDAPMKLNPGGSRQVVGRDSLDEFVAKNPVTAAQYLTPATKTGAAAGPSGVRMSTRLNPGIVATGAAGKRPAAPIESDRPAKWPTPSGDSLQPASDQDDLDTEDELVKVASKPTAAAGGAGPSSAAGARTRKAAPLPPGLVPPAAPPPAFVLSPVTGRLIEANLLYTPGDRRPHPITKRFADEFEDDSVDYIVERIVDEVVIPPKTRRGHPQRFFLVKWEGFECRPGLALQNGEFQENGRGDWNDYETVNELEALDIWRATHPE